MPYAYLGLGSNQGNRHENLQAAVDALTKEVAVVYASSTYDSRPLYLENQDRFLNAVVKIYTEKSAKDLLQTCQEIEKKLGKSVAVKNGPRTIDIDLLYFGKEVINQDGFIVPHPKISDRRFVLESLAEIAPQLKDPVFGKTVSEMLSTVQNQDVVKKDSLALFAPSCNAFDQVEAAEKAIAAVGVEDLYSIKTMAQKCITRVVHLRGVRATMANILKQEMLSLGGDAAVHADCISNKVDRSDVLLIGNLKQLRQLVSKLRVQVAEAQAVAKAVEKALRQREEIP